MGQAVDRALLGAAGGVKNALLMPSVALNAAGVPTGAAAAIGLGGTAAAGLVAANLAFPSDSRTQTLSAADQAHAFVPPATSIAGRSAPAAFTAPSAPVGAYSSSHDFNAEQFNAEQAAISEQVRRQRKAREEAEFAAAQRRP